MLSAIHVSLSTVIRENFAEGKSFQAKVKKQLLFVTATALVMLGVVQAATVAVDYVSGHQYDTLFFGQVSY